MQRVESGRLKGRRLMSLPRGVPGLRPTAARVRGAIFDSLGPAVVDARVLDLFGGSGALSIEALSRGARSATLVELDRRVVRFLQEQLAALGLTAQTRVICADALRFLQGRPDPEPYDLVLVDPPFATPDVFEPLAHRLVQGWLAPGGLVVCERERIRGMSPPVAWPSSLVERSSRVYGQALVEVLESSQSKEHP